MSVFDLARPNIRELVPYQSARRIGGQAQVFVNANEAGGLVNAAFDGAINRYPGAQPTELVADYARYCGLKPGQLLATRGADEGIEVLIRTFCEPELDAILIQPPTYGMYAITAETCAVAVKTTVSLQEADLSDAKLVFVCRPNNPTGEMMAPDDLKALLERAAGSALVVVDEAYIELAPTDARADIAIEDPRVIRMRSMSKAYGLAGARVGYALGAAELIKNFDKIRNHFGLNRSAQHAALAALRDNEWLAHIQSQISHARDRLSQIALDNGLTPIPSATNFVTMDCGRDGDYAAAVVRELGARGIFARMPGVAPLNRCIRISCGPDAALDLFAAALPQALKAAL